MALSVPAAKLHDFADLLRRAADDAAEAHGYVRRYGVVAHGEQGLLTRIIDLHDELAATVTATMERLEATLRASAGDVDTAAGHYRASDLREESRMRAARVRAER
ncbi:hypothetical protein CTZ27_05300 [Streptomyces griseocarneus]|nr:hypothetical protein CTZ27_05300 [Streptomyces griseocarneus]